MASANVQKILAGKSAPFSKADLKRMTDREAWSWLSGHMGDREGHNRKRRYPPSVAFDSAGFALGWHMAVPACFKDALDIQMTTRKQHGKEVLVETEGDPPYYSFSAGDTFYDTADAYKDSWGRSLSRIRLSVQVIHASGANLRVVFQRPRSDGSALVTFDERTLSHDELALFLQYGALPPQEDS